MQTEQYLEGRFDRADDYSSIIEFARTYNRIRYSEFDHCTVRNLNLFTLREHFDFDALEEALDQIIKTLPAIKRIFARPITRLKDTGEILPVESVRVISNRTIVHASGHSELWDDITEDGLKPRKLLTTRHEDNYSIYENIAFTRMVDMILHFIGRNIRLMRDMLYASHDMSFNLLERINHPLYFLAIGKLHIGYLRDYDRYREGAERCLDKMLFIDRVIRARLGSAVYKKCKHKGGKLSLKKTNIFRNHKDYHRIYLLLKWFSDAKIGDIEESDDEGHSGEAYGLFCSMLTLFAVGHFNFTVSNAMPIDFYNMNVDCSFDEWQLKLETVSCGSVAAIRLRFIKDRQYSILILPAIDRERGMAALEMFRAGCMADEYLLAQPIEEGKEHIYISLYDIESFRRLQQILLRGMIYSDMKRVTCPFCGRQLMKDDNGTVYECGACRTQLSYLICPVRRKPYIATSIMHLRRADSHTAPKDKLLYQRFLEGQMHYRNITALDDRAEPICPHCGEVHPIGE